jgi:hypothetical protein
VTLAGSWEDIAIPAAEYAAMMVPGARDVFRPPVPALLGLDLLLRRDGSSHGGDQAADNPSATYLMLDPATGRAPAVFQGVCTVARCAEWSAVASGNSGATAGDSSTTGDSATTGGSSAIPNAPPANFVPRKYTSADHQLLLDYMHLVFAAAAQAQAAPPPTALLPQAFQRFVRARLADMAGGGGASAMVRDAVSVVAPRVRLQGLADATLNGQAGCLGRRCRAGKGAAATAADRFEVHLDSGRNVAARREKLELVVDGFEEVPGGGASFEPATTAAVSAVAASDAGEPEAAAAPPPPPP